MAKFPFAKALMSNPSEVARSIAKVSIHVFLPSRIATWTIRLVSVRDSPCTSKMGSLPAKHKVQVVLRLLAGEDIKHLSRELGMTAAVLSEWRDRFLEAGETGLKPRPSRENVEVDRLQSKIGEQAMEIKL